MGAAESAFDNENFSMAESLYRQALIALESLEEDDNPELATCLHRLADTCFRQNNLTEALALYQRLSMMRLKNPSSHAKVVASLIKLSKTYQKMSVPEEADNTYKLTFELAEQSLPKGHPLFMLILESYQNLINEWGSELDAPAMEQLAQEKRDIYMAESKQYQEQHVQEEAETDHVAAQTTSSARVRLSTDMFRSARTEDLDKIETPKLRRTEEVEKPAENRARRPSPERLRESHAPVLGVLFAVVILLIGVSIPVLIPLFSTDENPKRGPADDYTGRVYTSSDELKHLRFYNEKSVEIFRFGEIVNAPYYFGIDDPMVLNFKRMLKPFTAFQVQETSQGMRDSEGTVLYGSAALDKLVLQKMDYIAELARFYYKSHDREYPYSVAEFSNLGQVRWTNPIDENGSTPMVQGKMFGHFEFDKVFDKTLDELTKGKEAKDMPGMIEVFSLRPSEIAVGEAKHSAVMIRGYDSTGKLIESSVPGEAYVKVLRDGMPYKVGVTKQPPPLGNGTIRVYVTGRR